MKNVLYATTAAVLAMLATSGIVALATAAPSEPEEEMQMYADPLADHLDKVIGRQLGEAKKRLNLPQ